MTPNTGKTAPAEDSVEQNLTKSITKSPTLMLLLLAATGGGGGWFANMSISGDYVKVMKAEQEKMRGDVMGIREEISKINTNITIMQRDIASEAKMAINEDRVEKIIRAMVRPESLR